MDPNTFTDLMNTFDKRSVYHELIKLHCSLVSDTPGSKQSAKSGINYELCLGQLNEIINKFKVAPTKKKAKEPKEETVEVQGSSNLFKLVSRSLVLVFNKLPTKVYDVANDLLNHLVLVDNELNSMGQLSIIVLSDLYETFPHSLGSLINFSVNQVYKILKKDANISSNLVYLLNSLTKYSTRNDVDEKLSAKLLKIITKNVTSLAVKSELTKADKSDGTSISLKKNYILVLRNLSVLSINANYEQLLASSASSTSGAKMKPGSIMVHQHQFQTALLSSIEKVVVYGLSDFHKDIRVSTTEALAHIFINFIPTGKFNAIEYLVNLYRLPDVNTWTDDLTRLKQDDQTFDPTEYSSKDYDDMLHHHTDSNCFNVGVLETIVFYIQLESFQNSDYLSSNTTDILTMILNKFQSVAVDGHVQNSLWVKVYEQWKKVIEFLVKESGPSCYEILVTYLFDKFDTEQVDTEEVSGTQKDKKSSTLFSLKGTKSSTKHKATDINAYHNSYQCGLLLSIINELLPFGIDFDSFVRKDEENPEEIDDSKRVEASSKSQLVDLLFTLIINKNDHIRNYALNTLSEYGKINVVEVNSLVLSCFKLFNTELQTLVESKKLEVVSSSETNTNSLVSVRLMSYALLLSTLIKQTQSIHLQNSTIVKILSFCTQTLKHNSTFSKSQNLKTTSCWVILSSLVTLYNESEFVKLNSSQFLVFWKSLLTSQYTPTGLGGGEDGHEKEILENLKLRNASLVCLSNYINTVELTPESSKQIQFLLTKAFNYLTYLETNVDLIGEITNFSTKINEESFNFEGTGNLLFSNGGYNDQISIKDAIVSTVLYSKKVIIRNYTKLVSYLKNDINSSMIVLLLKIFTDSNIFSHVTQDKIKSTKSKMVYNKVNDLDSDSIILGDDYTYHYGVTSKFNDFESSIDELVSEHQQMDPNEGLFYKDPFQSMDSFKGNIENNSSKETGGSFNSWFDYFERNIYESPVHSINYDPMVFLSGNYSHKYEFSTGLITSIVDASIELFQLVFPYLTMKIQSSLLESIRSSLTTKTIGSLRYRAICVNVSVAIHGTLNYSYGKKLSFEKDIITVFIDILKKINTCSMNLIDINSDSIGLAASFIDTKKYTSDQVDEYVSTIVNDTDPLTRGKAILSMAKIYSYTGTGSNDIYNVVSQLLNDSNPVVHYCSLKATALLFDNNLANTSWVSPLLSSIFTTFLDDNFSYDIKDKDLVNVKYKLSSLGAITTVLKIFTTNLGPNLRTLPQSNRDELRSLIVSLSYSIGTSSISDGLFVFKELLQLLQELIIFDPDLIEDELHFYSTILISVVSKNLKVGLATISATSLNYESIFPFNSSFELYKLGYGCFGELVKVYGTEILSKEVVQLIWVSLNLKPCEQSKKLIELWMESSPEMNWFATLNSLFKMSSKKLTQPYIQVNFQQKLLPLLQRQKKKADQTIDFKDEEIENIVGETSDEDDKNEPITWEFKLFIYDLLNELLAMAYKDPALLDKLKRRISDLVKIAFLGSTSPINNIKLKGMSLLDKVLGLFGDMEDSMYTGISILEQQQAQIISAIIPCFNSGSTPDVIVNAVNVSSKFINLPRIKFYSKQRILKTLIYFLEELSSNKFIRFGFLENMSEHSKKAIQVAILNCWALVRLTTAEDIKNGKLNLSGDRDEEDEESQPENELLETLDKYSTLLIALWIVSLKEFSTLKYSDPHSKELGIYHNYWINFISVLSLELEENNTFVDEHLAGDASTFFFILFSQCVESLIRNKNIIEVLGCLNSLVKNKDLVDILFHDEIFGEVVDLFDRLILVDDETEIEIKLIEIVDSLFQTYFESHKDLAQGFDKLFELIRLCMLPLFNALPFLKSDYDAEDKQTQLVIRKVDSGPNLVIIRTVFNKLVFMMPRFPDVVKVDLYSCFLFIICKIYEFQNELLISAILPYLKQIIQEAKQLQPKLVQDFNDIVEDKYPIDTSNSSVLTYMILLTVGDMKLNESNCIFMKDSLIRMVSSPETNSLGFQCIKSLTSFKNHTGNTLISKLLIKDIIKMIVDETIDGKIGIEILIMYVKNQTEESIITKFYMILVPLILSCNKKLNQYYLHEKLVILINVSSGSFKSIVNDNLNGEQRQLTEDLVKLSVEREEIEEGIQLKTFS